MNSRETKFLDEDDETRLNSPVSKVDADDDETRLPTPTLQLKLHPTTRQSPRLLAK
jgi:hypothetical protein